MQIVATHNSLDFDALAAAFAVTKLNPTARIALCSPVLGNIRDFLTLHRNNLSLVPMKHLKDKAKEISKIFLVDCQHILRLDPVIQQLIKAGIPYAVFDHHEFDDNKTSLGIDAQTDSIIECVGAATTLLVEQIKNRGIKLNSFEASLLALGIYEDTGALTYSSTTYRDAACVTFLLQQGADLQLINQYMRTKLNESQQALFEQLVSHARVVNMSGQRVVFSAANCDEYIDGLAVLTRKLMEVESADATFVAVYMRDRIYLVGRSDSSIINVRNVVHLYGGDGHPGAASAAIKSIDKNNSSAAAILNNIEEFLQKNVVPELTAVQIMSVPAKMILPSVSMEEAGKIMIRHDLDGLLIAEEGEILGVISKRDVDQAQHHQLDHAPVSGFMSHPVITVKPGTTLSEIQSILTTHNIGRVPVLNSAGKLLGLVSRTDILQALFSKSPFAHQISPIKDPLSETEDIQEIGTLQNLHDPLQALDADNLWLYKEIGSAAVALNMTAYAVGGSVRDMLLGFQTFDLDFVIEGSAIAVAEKLVKRHPDKFMITNKHERFQTATLSFLGKESHLIDLSTARQEFYEYPAALPTVEPSLLKEDVFRRDFTINTLALSLNPNNFGKLINHFNGLEDLTLGTVRVLHQFSFIEDPTRILRAARFASRFAFIIDQNTAQLASHAIEMGIFDNLGGVRMKEELRLILESPSRLEALEILSKLGAKLRYLDEELEYGIEQRKLLRRAKQLLSRYPLNKEDNWLVYLALLLSNIPSARLENVLARLHLAAEARDSIARGLAIEEQLLRFGKNPKRSQIYAVLHNNNDISLAIAASLSAPGSPVRRSIKLYFEELKEIKTDLDGEDLLKSGFKEGRELGKALQALLNAKLDQIICNRQEELAFIESELAAK
jgi:tRNA nucleotidyltransferase (CCA-adding enzyme)